MKIVKPKLFFREDSAHPVHTGNLALVDVETSGFSFDKGAEIVEIAVLVMTQDGTIVQEYDTLIGARGGVGDSSIHRITRSMVRGAPSFADVAGDLLQMLTGTVVVAHNISFEDRFLRPEFERAGVDGLSLPGLCSLRAARAALPFLSSHKLGDLVMSLGHRMQDAHTALGDVRALAKIMPELIEGSDILRFAPGMVPVHDAYDVPVHSRMRGSVPAPRSGDGRRVRSESSPTHSSVPPARVPRDRTPRNYSGTPSWASADAQMQPYGVSSERVGERVPRSREQRVRD